MHLVYCMGALAGALGSLPVWLKVFLVTVHQMGRYRIGRNHNFGPLHGRGGWRPWLAARLAQGVFLYTKWVGQCMITVLLCI